jgi:hypothetical protein
MATERTRLPQPYKALQYPPGSKCYCRLCFITAAHRVGVTGKSVRQSDWKKAVIGHGGLNK